MAGHNKFSKIKHKKAASDAKKSKMFSMYARMITIKSKEVGGDTSHPALRAIIDKAKKENMPNDNIDRAVKKGVGGDSGNLSEVMYEAYGPGGTALLIEGITDNNNRTNQEVKHALTKMGYSLGAPGSASWAFTKMEEDGEQVYKPQTPTELSDDDVNKLEKLVDALEELDDIKTVYTSAD